MVIDADAPMGSSSLCTSPESDHHFLIIFSSFSHHFLHDLVILGNPLFVTKRYFEPGMKRIFQHHWISRRRAYAPYPHAVAQVGDDASMKMFKKAWRQVTIKSLLCSIMLYIYRREYQSYITKHLYSSYDIW